MFLEGKGAVPFRKSCVSAACGMLLRLHNMAVVEFVPAQAVGGGEMAALAAHGRAQKFLFLQQAVEEMFVQIRRDVRYG